MCKINLLIKQRMIDSFFFVRYMDPNYHIRLRLHCTNINNYAFILHLIYKTLNRYVKDLIITKVQLDTYTRELERYEYNEIVHFETFFYYDSCLITKCLKRLKLYRPR